jgi:transcriptional regulator of arginine metabolism
MTVRIGKPQRQHRIAKLIEDGSVATQEQLVELLARQGVDATQTTVSRDLEELGAVKVRVKGGTTVYALAELPTRQVAPEDHLRRVLGEWLVEVDHSSNLVVLRTPPGSAHVVGSALDRSGFEGIVGTVAGDDTVLVVASEGVGGAKLASRLAEVAGRFRVDAEEQLPNGTRPNGGNKARRGDRAKRGGRVKGAGSAGGRRTKGDAP